ncbi:MAG: AcrR family transcriptional regulator [Bradymonadia bacterium]|jgi:AcrR family transcriptional regulator
MSNDSSQQMTRRQPRQARSRALVDAIEEAAAHVLVTHGYEFAGTCVIADRAGVSIGSLYQYFGGKDAIFDALTQRLLGELVEAIQDATSADPGASLAGRAEATLLACFSVVSPYPSVLRQLSAINTASFSQRLEFARASARATAEALLQERSAALVVSDIPLAARICVELCEGLVLNLKPGDDLQALAREGGRAVSRYIAGAAI